MAEHLLSSHPVLSVILYKLFNLIITLKYVPRGFKLSYLVPIPKPKDHHCKALSCDDFREIAISPIISKVFEYCLDFSHSYHPVTNSLVSRKESVVATLFIL